MRKIGIGIQNYEKMRRNGHFYVDKTRFIQQWWAYGDEVTLITRPRRFGKTLMMSMVEAFFPSDTQGEGIYLKGWKCGKMRICESFRGRTQCCLSVLRI